MNSNAKLALIIMLGLIVLLLPHLLRNYDAKIGEQTYFYERIINLWRDKLSNYDELSYSGRDLTYDLGPIYLLFYLNKIINLNILFFILPIILGLLTIIIFYFLLKKLNVEENEINLTLILFIISPLFLYIFTSYSKLTLVIPLVLLTLYLFVKNNKFYCLSLFLLGFFSYKCLILSLFFILIYLLKEKKFKNFYLPLVISFISFIFAYIPRIIKYGLTSYKINENYFKILLNDLGSPFGLSIFLIIFIFFGLNHLWKSKYKHLTIYLLFILSLILSIFDSEYIIYFSFLYFYMAALGLNYLIKSTWDSELIRKLTIILLLIGLILSSYSSLNNIKSSYPSKGLYDALNDIKGLGSSRDIVFSHYKYGIFINSISNKKNYMDTNFNYIPDLKNRHQDMQNLFYYKNADKSKELINKYNIKYILITKEMKNGLVWNNEGEGLLFVLQNSKEFKKIYYNDDMEVWRVA